MSIAAGTERSHGFGAVDELALVVLFRERLVAAFLHALGDFFHRPFPFHFFPFGGVGGAVKRLLGALIVDGKLPRGRALGTEGALVDRVIRIAFDVDGAALAERVVRCAGADDEPAAHGTVTADGCGLFRPLEFEFLGLRESGAQVESEPGNGARQRGPKTELQKGLGVIRSW